MKLSEITEEIEELISDTAADQYHAGHDEGWEAAVVYYKFSETCLYSQGIHHGIAELSKKIDLEAMTNGLFVTPRNSQELADMINMHKDNGLMCSIIMGNFFKRQLDIVLADHPYSPENTL